VVLQGGRVVEFNAPGVGNFAAVITARDAGKSS